MKVERKYKKTQYISNRGSRKRSCREKKKKRKGENVFKETKPKNFLDLMKDMNHKLSK